MVLPELSCSSAPENFATGFPSTRTVPSALTSTAFPLVTLFAAIFNATTVIAGAGGAGGAVVAALEAALEAADGAGTSAVADDGAGAESTGAAAALFAGSGLSAGFGLPPHATASTAS